MYVVEVGDEGWCYPAEVGPMGAGLAHSTSCTGAQQIFMSLQLWATGPRQQLPYKDMLHGKGGGGQLCLDRYSQRIWRVAMKIALAV